MAAFTLSMDNKNYAIEWGQLYVVSASRKELDDFFSNNENGVTFINMPFKQAIKIRSYFKWNWLKRNNILNKVNQLAVFPRKLSYHSYFESLILILYAEIRHKKILVIEIAGMDDLSIINSLKFSYVLFKQV